MKIQLLSVSALTLAMFAQACADAGPETPEGGALALPLNADATDAPANPGTQARVLHEIRLSETRTIQFLELGSGEVVVSHVGSVTDDALPADEFAGLTALEVFAALSDEAPPEALVLAERRSRELDDLWANAPADFDPRALPGAPPIAEEATSEAAARQFLGNAWWEGLACNSSGYTDSFTLNGEQFHPYIGCWSNTYSWVNSGDLGITMNWEAYFAGISSSASYKHWWVTCTNYVLFTNCSWTNDTASVNQGYWNVWSSSARRTRAGDMSTPNNTGGGYFAIRTDSPNLASPNSNMCRMDVANPGALCPWF